MIKVANIIEDGRLAGPQHRIIKVSEKLLSFGIETTVIFPENDSTELKEALKNKSIRLKSVPINRLTRSFVGLFKYMVTFVFEVLRLVRFFKKEKFDLVHVSGGAWQIKGVIAGRLAKSKVIWHLNDTQMPFIIRWSFSFLVRYTHGLIFAGYGVHEYYSGLLKSKDKPYKIIQAPVEYDEYIKLLRPKEFLDGYYNVVSVASINPVKGFERFIEVASKINKENFKVNFWIVGPVYKSQHKYHQRLVERIKELNLENVIKFYGPTNSVYDLLDSADVYLCTSVAEASPTSVWEAMISGTPVVSTNVGDVGRFITDGENGFVVNRETPVEEMTEKLTLLLNDKNLREDFGLKAKEVARKSLSLEKTVKDHFDFYCKVSGRGVT